MEASILGIKDKESAGSESRFVVLLPLLSHVEPLYAHIAGR